MRDTYLYGSIVDPSPHYDERALSISCIVLHYTAMESFTDALHILTGRNTDINGRVSAHYAIARCGTLYTLVPESKRAWHAGAGRIHSVQDVNSASIGIELDNAGHTFFQYHGYWPPYTDPLLDTLISLIGQICSRYPNIDPLRDIVGHCHVAPQRKIDPGPHFPWSRLWQAFS